MSPCFNLFQLPQLWFSLPIAPFSALACEGWHVDLFISVPTGAWHVTSTCLVSEWVNNWKRAEQSEGVSVCYISLIPLRISPPYPLFGRHSVKMMPVSSMFPNKPQFWEALGQNFSIGRILRHDLIHSQSSSWIISLTFLICPLSPFICSFIFSLCWPSVMCPFALDVREMTILAFIQSVIVKYWAKLLHGRNNDNCGG